MRFWQAGALGALTAGAVLLGPAAWSVAVLPRPSGAVVSLAFVVGATPSAPDGLSGPGGRGPVLTPLSGSATADPLTTSPATRPTGSPDRTGTTDPNPTAGATTATSGPGTTAAAVSSAPAGTTSSTSGSTFATTGAPQTVSPSRVVSVHEDDDGPSDAADRLEPDRDDD